MIWPLIASLAVAGNLVIDAKIPTEVWVDDQLAGQLAVAAELHLDYPPGEVEITLMTYGSPNTVRVELPSVGHALVVVGRTGITTGRGAPPAPPDGTASSVEFRSSAREDLVLHLGETRYDLSPRDTVTVALDHGEHTMAVRNRDGTVVWASGILDVAGDGLVVQLADGRMPETAGPGGSFHPGQR